MSGNGCPTIGLELLGIPDTHSFRIQYVEQIRLAIEQNKLHREKRWAESIAVGSQSYVAKIEESLQYRRRKFIVEEEDDGTCAIWESCAIYSKSQAGLFIIRHHKILLNAKNKEQNRS
jgi:hypothetical protein